LPFDFALKPSFADCGFDGCCSDGAGVSAGFFAAEPSTFVLVWDGCWVNNWEALGYWGDCCRGGMLVALDVADVAGVAAFELVVGAVLLLVGEALLCCDCWPDFASFPPSKAAIKRLFKSSFETSGVKYSCNVPFLRVHKISSDST
jgi:hypothetical protein